MSGGGGCALSVRRLRVGRWPVRHDIRHPLSLHNMGTALLKAQETMVRNGRNIYNHRDAVKASMTGVHSHRDPI